MITHHSSGCRQALLAACLSLLSLSSLKAASAPTGPALERPAVSSKRPTQAVLLGMAQAGKRIVAVGERGIVLVSDDNALHWRQVAAPVSVTLTAVHFADALHGYAVGHSGTVLATSDSGETWSRVFDGTQAGQRAVEAAEASGDAAALRDARRLVADGPDKPLLDLLVIDRQRVIVIGAYGMAYATSDGGQHWTGIAQQLANPGALHLYAIRRHGQRVVVCGEQGLARLSEDGGQTFSVLKTPYQGSYFTAELPSADNIVLAGLRGNLLRSSDAGRTWTQATLPAAATVTASALQGDGTLTLANQAGMVLVEKHGVFAPLNRLPLPSLTGVFSKTDGSILALSVQGLLAATQGEQK